jgi:hypothetical protein
MHNLSIDQIAEVCHEANRAYCRVLGDFSQPSWQISPEAQKQSLIKGVQFRLANPDAPAEAQHQAWLKDKLSDGWQYGPTKNPEQKLHPCCRPYLDLPLAQRLKDRLFGSIVESLQPLLPASQLTLES